MSRRVAFLVCHLSGVGHLSRALALARAVAAAGGRPTVISGGAPVPHLDARGVDLIQLPPLAVAGLDYATPRGLDGAPADAGYRASRGVALHAALEAARPQALVTELFPFGRRALADEFELAITMARARGARVWCSVRDIPEPPRKAGRIAEAHARLAEYDGVLAHGDAAIAPFSLGWPGGALPVPTIETGYVADPAPSPAGDPEEVLVAEGGGALGGPLAAVAVAAAALGDGRPWRLRLGGADAAARAARLAAGAGGPPVVVEPAAPDYRARLGACAASVSLLGYNTAVDLLQSRAPAVVCPMVAGGEREQRLRADAFASLPQFEMLDPEALTPQALAAAVARAVARGRAPGPPPVRLDGAARAAAVLLA